MITLNKKIRTIESLPNNKKKKTNIISIFISLLLITVIIFGIYIGYIKLLPYINAIPTEKIVGKKTYITDCNTKDYIIINKDKSFSLGLTDDNCKTNYYEGNINIKNNIISFNKSINGIIDNKYNIIINNNIFESDKNE